MTDGQDGNILDVIPDKYIVEDWHERSLNNLEETYELITWADMPFSEHLQDRNRLLVPDEDGTYREFIITIPRKYRDGQRLVLEVTALASYLEDLTKAKVIEPHKTKSITNVEHVKNTLEGTIWQPGNIKYEGIRTLTIEKNTNPFAILKRLANEFGLEINFRIEIEYNRVVGRYVDMVERIGEWRGRTIEFAKDLLGIERTEDTSDVVTSLIGYGPERDNGTRLKVVVEDKEALERWGIRDPVTGQLKHLVAEYEPQSDDQDMTLDRLRTLVENELEKRIKALVSYKVTFADVEHVPGLENEKVRFGDTDRIKDTRFNPPLYLEARVHKLGRSTVDKSRKQAELGDFTEYTEEEAHAIWKSLQDQIRRKISMTEMLEATYDKLTIDQKDKVIFQEGKSFAEAVGIEVKDYADKSSNQALIDAKAYAVAQTVFDNKMIDLAEEMADKAGIEYVNGQLVDKVNVGDVYTIEEINNRFLNYVGLTQYETDMQGIVLDLETQSTQIGQNEAAIGLKADASYVNAIAGTVEDHSAQFNVMANEINSKVDATYVQGEIGKIDDSIDDLNTLVRNQSTQITQNANAILERATKTEVDAVNHRVKDAIGEIETIAGQIRLKANKTDFDTLNDKVLTNQSQINVMAGKLEFKAESSEVNALGERVNSAEVTIDGLKSEVELKADRIELKGFVTANDLKVRGDLEFGGKLRGATGTFSGEVEAAQLFIRNPKIEQEGGVGLQLQTAMWQSSTSRPFRKTGYIDFNTLNNALEVRRYNEQGAEYALDGFSMHAKVSAFYGDVRVGSGDEGGVPRLEFDIPERINRSSIRWNANVSADYGLIVQVDGDNVASFVSKGNLKVNRIEPYDTLGLYIMSHPKGSIRCTDYNGWNNGNPRYVDVLAGDFIRQSTERSKDNIEKYEENALEILDQSVIYQYTKNDKKEIGFILEKETPDIIKREEGISGYSLDGLLVKAVQELSFFKDQHNDRINFLEMQVDVLMQEINNLKGVS
ncbi:MULTISPECIES: phage tail spike protein [Clostridia]|uniref:phage tail spike protein n=1 Tax=Clostridia TaxID=186801 RepID=UPI0025708B75|nr:phage tail spike protein [Clostridium sp. 1xD42-85]